MFDNQIREIGIGTEETKGLELLKSRSSVGSLSETDEYSVDEMHRFWLNSRNIQESPISGREPFPGEMLRPSLENIRPSNSMLDLIVEYYTATYEPMKFRRPFGQGSLNDTIIRVKINKFGRCRIGSELFGSVMSSRHVKSSYVLAKFVTNDNSVDCYPGQIQYFFKHIVDLPQPTEHFLAYVRWYQPVNSSNVRYHFGIDDVCNVELWRTEFYPESRDCIIPVHHILGRFIPVKYKLSDRRNAVEYLAVNPISRKYQI
jgi:hypothetical protein